MKIVVFGLGYVGCVSVACLARDGHDLVGVDLSRNKVDLVNAGKPTIIEAELESVLAEAHAAGRVRATTDAAEALVGADASILCVGTPNTRDGHLDTTALVRVAEKIGEHLDKTEDYHVVLIRSTVMPGTNRRVASALQTSSGAKEGEAFDVVSNPEFLRESTAIADFYKPPVTVIGTESERAFDVACEIYAAIDAPVRRTAVGVAESIKLVNNSWHALKVTFANEVGVIAKHLGVDSHELMDLFCMDQKLNLSSYYLKPGFAYGGSCLPKDLRALTTISHDAYLRTPVLDAISPSNEIHTGRVIERIEELGRRKIGILGLSFKAGTDDLRNSPIVDVAQGLLGRGYELRIHDRNVHFSSLMGQNREYIESRIPHLGELVTDDIDAVIDHAEVVIVANREEEFRSVLDRCEGKHVIDLVRLFGRDDEERLGYEGIAW